MWLRMAGEFMSIYIFGVRFEQSTVATYDRISKLFIIRIRFYLFFRFTVKVCGMKTEHSDVATYDGRIHVYIYFWGGPFLLNSSCRDFEKVDEGRKLRSQLWVCMTRYQNYINYVGRKLNTLMWICMA